MQTRQHAQGAFLAEQGLEKFKITAAGLNHFTWMLQVQDRPPVRTSTPFPCSLGRRPAFEPLTDGSSIFLGFPIPGDEHLANTCPGCATPNQALGAL